MDFPELGLSRKKATKYLRQLGHQNLTGYQLWYHLKADDILGPVTSSHLMQPRCGVPDFAGALEAKWPRDCQDVPTAYEMSFSSISPEQVDEAWLLGINGWNKVCGIRMTVVEGLSNGKIWARSGALPGSTLAWSFLANDNCSSRLEQKYDTTVNWNLHFLAKTILHEVGHALGLQHSNRRADIMYPSISGDPWSNYPSTNDISRVVERYGEPQPVPEPPTPEPPFPQPPGGPVVIHDGGFSVVVAGQMVKLKVIESSGL